MSGLTVDGLEGLMKDFTLLADTPRSVQDDILTAQATVLMKHQVSKGRAYRVHDTGLTLKSIRLNKPRSIKGGRSISITFAGERIRHGRATRNAEIAFVTEYGTSRQAPRPFIADGNKAGDAEADQAGVDVYDRWLKKNNL